MYGASLRGGAIIGALLSVVAVSVAEESGPRAPASPTVPPAARTGQVAPDATDREAIPPFMTPGQLNLTTEQRHQIRQSIEGTNVEQQPVPRAFAPAAGQTAPPELKLTPLPQEVHQIPGISDHQFARLEDGAILIVNKDGLVAAMIRPDER